ncbi:DUF445 family protein [Alkalihalobacillus oceani]|uniref:DUF445 domain-containing protein n=1 Tax=Halalkalibacter oceani TaxID=1653776 RepID=UPI002041E03D|nr:DUF445 family protein [Halalkalibacter oceani]MCM3762844.1 DUF445 family protein [Halalkalibacter oceani]
MQTVGLIGFMVIIGAIIGGVTNSLAIKMLFRPYREIKIRGWRLPFTPGLIPKRHDELASQLGKMVVDYLLTAEGLTKKLKSSAFTTGMTSWLQGEVKKLAASEVSVAQLLKEHTEIKEPKQLMVEHTERFVQQKYRAFFDRHQQTALEQLLPAPLLGAVEQQIPKLTAYLLERGQHFLQQPEGKERLSIMIDRFLAQKGTIGNMVSMFLGNERLVDKVQPELIKFFRDEGTSQLVENLLTQEWDKIRQKRLGELEEFLNEEQTVDWLVQTAERQIPVYQWLELPLNEWAAKYKETVTTAIIPKGVDLLTDWLALHLETLLASFHLDEIVREQVQAFSVERLEELVLSISRREFKMITYLGALLGGVIGLIQSFIVLMLG